MLGKDTDWWKRWTIGDKRRVEEVVFTYLIYNGLGDSIEHFRLSRIHTKYLVKRVALGEFLVGRTIWDIDLPGSCIGRHDSWLTSLLLCLICWANTDCHLNVSSLFCISTSRRHDWLMNSGDFQCHLEETRGILMSTLLPLPIHLSLFFHHMDVRSTASFLFVREISNK